MEKTLIMMFLLVFSCKNATNHSEVHRYEYESEIADTINEGNQALSCEGLFQDVIESSDLSILRELKSIFIRIEERSDSKITLELYTINNLSEFSDQVQNVENAIAWLEFFPDSQRLIDITADPDHPLEIIFNKEILSNYDFAKICGLQSMNQEETSKDLPPKNCKKITGEMQFGEEC